MNHLSDKNIQDFLAPDVRAEQKVWMSDHLNQCSRCRQSLRIYQQLFRALEAAPDPAFAPQFTDTVYSGAVRSTQKRERLEWIKRGFLYAAGLFVGVGYGITVIDAESFINPFTNTFRFDSFFPVQALGDLQKIFTHHGVDLEVLVMSVIVLAIIACVDQLFMRGRRANVLSKSFHFI